MLAHSIKSTCAHTHTPDLKNLLTIFNLASNILIPIFVSLKGRKTSPCDIYTRLHNPEKTKSIKVSLAWLLTDLGVF